MAGDFAPGPGGFAPGPGGFNISIPAVTPITPAPVPPTVSWTFESILTAYGSDVTWQQRQADNSLLNKGSILAIIQPLKTEEILREPNWMDFQWKKMYTSTAVDYGDRVVFEDKIWDVVKASEHWESPTMSYYKSVIRSRRRKA